MVTSVAINGAGRIGLLTARILLNKAIAGNSDIALKLINDPFANLDNVIYKMTFDSVHGRFAHSVEKKGEDTIVVAGKHEIKFVQQKNPEDIPYKANAVKVVLECTGVFNTDEKAKRHLDGGKTGVEQVIISAPASGPEIKTIVMGINENEFDKSKHKVVSNASCTTNCLAPIVKVLDNAFKIKWGTMCTTHAVTATQKTVDGAGTKDFANGRSTFNNIIPASTGAAKAIGKVFPHLEGKLNGFALRVPTSDCSVTVYTVEVEKATTIAEVQNKLKEAAAGDLKGILAIAPQFTVSTDFIGDSHSSIAQMEQIDVMNEGKVITGLSFYDNEWGYSNRLADLLAFIAKKL